MLHIHMFLLVIYKPYEIEIMFDNTESYETTTVKLY